MPDLYISYARADRDAIVRLTSALEGAGYSLWWDKEIAGGVRFSKEIERNLAAAKAVIVAWSAASVESMWVADEAAFARDAGKLVPIALDDVVPPLGFRQVQTIPFAAWRGDVGSSEFAELCRAIDRLAPDDAGASSPRSASRDARRSGRRFLVAVGLVAFAFAIAAFVPAGRAPNPSEQVATATHAVPASQARFESIAVLPFTDMSEAKDQGYLADGVADELLNALARRSNLRVVARTSSFSFKGKDVGIAEIAAALGADALIEGSVRKSGGRLRVTVQIIDAANGYHLWSDQFERAADEIFELQDEVASATAATLRTALAPQERPTQIVAAYDRYLDGLHHFYARAGQAGFSAARDAFAEAVALDPGFAKAYARLASVSLYLALGSFGDVAPADANAQAKRFIEKARSIAPDDPDVIAAFIHVLRRTGEGYRAGHEIERGLALHPNDVEINSFAARHLFAVNLQAALERVDRALSLDPRSIELLRLKMELLNRSGRRVEADALLSVARSVAPTEIWVIIAAALQANDYGDPVRSLRFYLEGLELSPDDLLLRVNPALLLAEYGFADEAEALVSDESYLAMVRAITGRERASVAEFVERRLADLPGRMAWQLLQATNDYALMLPLARTELERFQREGGSDARAPSVIMALRHAGDVEGAAAAAAAFRHDLEAQHQHGFRGPEYYVLAAELTAADCDAPQVVQSLEQGLASFRLRVSPDMLHRFAAWCADLAADPGFEAVAARLEAEWRGQRESIIASDVLDEFRKYSVARASAQR